MGKGWLTGNEIIRQVESGSIHIEPFDINMVNPNSYNYHLHPRLLRLKNEILDLKYSDEYEIIDIPAEGVVLFPGECYLGSTIEKFGSDKYASLVTGRSSIGRKFITNHVTAGLIDQGFYGNITLEITVCKKVRVYPNIVFGQIFWFDVDGTPRLYNGKYQNQNEATPSRYHYDMSLNINCKEKVCTMEYYDTCKERLKIAFLAPTGYGKTTAVNYLSKQYNGHKLKLSRPLYEIQRLYYQVLGVEIAEQQDGELLQFLGNKIQKDYPRFLADKFYLEVKKIDAQYDSNEMILNDDCRPHNYSFLKEMGFKFVKINGNVHFREDITKVDSNNKVEWQGTIPYDYEIDNYGDLDRFYCNLDRLMGEVLGK